MEEDDGDGAPPNDRLAKLPVAVWFGSWLVTASPTKAFVSMLMVVLPTSVHAVPVGELYALNTLPVRTKRNQTGAATTSPLTCPALRPVRERH